ncbi:hypothetical protein J437_LFUL015512 [Ladona fulva]|uniref:Transcriptional regulator ATRX n=1 Tax=Ladona fulva TaxID=123851 RepID=A0A8K0KIM7_LADFU|nr:hypothetical protein J437_LFUL015512 [Ladona fulva]
MLHNPKIDVKTILVICPLNTVLNWVNEFEIWLKDMQNDIEIFELTRFKANVERMYQLKEWHSSGGVMILGYDMYRVLLNGKNRRKKVQETFISTLADPGPDLVICDEGHLLKNLQSALSKAVNSIKTERRIVLTGTPLQNNLKEYHCMIQFVKPNLLGTHKEFLNRFVNPISNGQCADSTPHDVKIMKRRAHVLHKMLDGCVQRRDFSVMIPYLPPKHEYVVLICLTELQTKLYSHYIQTFSQRGTGGGASLFNDFQNLQRIWTHPRVLKMSTEKQELRKMMQSDSEGSLKDFICDDTDESDTTETSSESSNDDKKKKRKKLKRNCKAEDSSSSESSDVICVDSENKEKEVNEGEETFNVFILLFSQSLYSLDLIEYFLEYIDSSTTNSQRLNQSTEGDEGSSFNFTGSWEKGIDYFRIDGSVSGENRSIWCKSFNREDNSRARLFLISTRAGGMGINLVGANRVILFDASWNPSNDVQSIYRVYRFGQKKPCYVYRFLAQGTMEEKIYNRQVTKLSLASRVLDEHQIERHYNFDDLQELYSYEPTDMSKRPTPILPKDRLLAELIQSYPNLIYNYHEHDSLLQNIAEEELTEEERKAAWDDFENEKTPKIPDNLPMGFGGIVNSNFIGGIPYPTITNAIPGLMEALMKKYPNATQEQLSSELRHINNQLTHYFPDHQQQLYNQMLPDNMMQQNYSLYPEMRQRFQQSAMMDQLSYQNYAASPYFTNSSNSSHSTARPTKVQNNPQQYASNAQSVPPVQFPTQTGITKSLLLNKDSVMKAPSLTEKTKPIIKIRSDLLPASNDDDIIIESVQRRE